MRPLQAAASLRAAATRVASASPTSMSVARRMRLPRAGFTAPRGAVRLSGPHLTLVSFPALPKQGGIAVVISKKAAKTATVRHGAKRRILAGMASHTKAGYADIVHAKAGIGEISAAELRAELTALYARLPRR